MDISTKTDFGGETTESFEKPIKHSNDMLPTNSCEDDCSIIIPKTTKIILKISCSKPEPLTTTKKVKSLARNKSPNEKKQKRNSTKNNKRKADEIENNNDEFHIENNPETNIIDLCGDIINDDEILASKYELLMENYKNLATKHNNLKETYDKIEKDHGKLIKKNKSLIKDNDGFYDIYDDYVHENKKLKKKIKKFKKAKHI